MFGLFKKKVNIKDYCRKKYDFIFSASGRKIMDDLLKRCNVSLGEVQKEKYRDHFIAAYFQLTGVAFSRTISRDLRYEVMSFSKEYLEEKNSSHIDEISRIYNSAFGSSFQDGIRPMADIISKEMSGDSTVFYDAFYGIVDAFFADIKGEFTT
jgi:hypothetical protein